MTDEERAARDERWWKHGFRMSDDELKSYVRAFREGILEGRKSNRMCFMIVAPLATLLSMEGLLVRVVEGETKDGDQHYWMELPDGSVLDPTLDQFGEAFPDVYLGPRLDDYHRVGMPPPTRSTALAPAPRS